MGTTMKPVGYVQTDAPSIPHFWDVSDVEGVLAIDEPYADGLKGLEKGKKIFVIFQFHRSPPFRADQVRQTPRGGGGQKGVFAISSPFRPNPVGLSVLEILAIDGPRIRVKGLDMIDGTPILDIKPCHLPGSE